VRSVLIGPIYPYRGGIAHYTAMLHRALREHGHEVLLVSFKRQYPQWLFPGQSDKDPSDDSIGIEEAQYWIDSLNPITWLVTSWRIRRCQPDVVILSWWTTFWAPAWFVIGMLHRLFLSRPLVILCHNVLPHEARPWDRWLVRAVLRWGTRFIVQSIQEEKQLLTLIPRAQADIVPHPIYDMLADQRMSREEARRRLGLPLDERVLLFFGIVRQYKGLADILAALPEILAQLGSVTLIVAGEFWDDKRPYQEMIERLGVDKSVIIEDRYIPNAEVAIYFSATDVLVAPYRHTTGSGVVQMAKGFGTPVITTDVGGLATMVIDGKTGFVVPPGDLGALATAVTRYFHEAHGTRMRQAITQSVGVFSWEALIRSLERIVQGE
jgi:glycosyltransferase involved in cell wall biosynthesis